MLIIFYILPLQKNSDSQYSSVKAVIYHNTTLSTTSTCYLPMAYDDMDLNLIFFTKRALKVTRDLKRSKIWSKPITEAERAYLVLGYDPLCSCKIATCGVHSAMTGLLV